MPANGPVHPVRFFDLNRKLALWWWAGALLAIYLVVLAVVVATS